MPPSLITTVGMSPAGTKSQTRDLVPSFSWGLCVPRERLGKDSNPHQLGGICSSGRAQRAAELPHKLC